MIIKITIMLLIFEKKGDSEVIRYETLPTHFRSPTFHFFHLKKDHKPKTHPSIFRVHSHFLPLKSCHPLLISDRLFLSISLLSFLLLSSHKKLCLRLLFSDGCPFIKECLFVNNLHFEVIRIKEYLLENVSFRWKSCDYYW